MHAIPPSFIELPNRNNNVANFEGTMKLGPKFIIHNVFYIPNLMCNLISISQLLHFNHEYNVYFSKSFVLYKTIF